MKERISVTLAILALVLNPCAVAVFAVWVSTLSFSSGHYRIGLSHQGPPGLLVVSIVLSSLGVCATLAYFYCAYFWRPVERQGRVRGRRVVLVLVLMAVTAPEVVVLPVSLWRLPASREHARMERVLDQFYPNRAK